MRLRFQNAGYQLTDDQLHKFQGFYNLLTIWNKRINLTTITSREDVCGKHFIDSFKPMEYYDFKRGKYIDIGSGAGFPGIPLAIMNPASNFTLVDSLNKRVMFLEEVVTRLGINNVTCIHNRSEILAQSEEHREKYDYAISRAVAGLPSLCELCIPFVKVGGDFLAYKSITATKEINDSQRILKLLDSEVVRTFDYSLPLSNASRTVIVINKKKATKSIYPRKAGMPVKRPII